MPVMDEFREERQAMKNASPKQKLSYFWLYYKWHVIIGIFAIVSIASFIYTNVTRKETVLHAMMVNIYSADSDLAETYNQDFLNTTEIDTKEYDILIDSSYPMKLEGIDEGSYGTMQKITVYVATGELDLFAADGEIFQHYAYQDEFMADIRTMLTPEQVEKYSPHFHYIDRKVVAAKQEAIENLEEYTQPYPDPTKPEEMEDPIPVGIFLDTASEAFKSIYFSSVDANSAIGFVINASNIDNAQRYLDYIFTETE